jgi:hypothetical protein
MGRPVRNLNSRGAETDANWYEFKTMQNRSISVTALNKKTFNLFEYNNGDSMADSEKM